MEFLKEILEKQKPLFEKGGKFEKFYYLFEAGATFLFTPDEVTKSRGAQVRDAIDLKRMMITVVVAMLPCLLFGIWNAGHQFFLATTGASGSIGDEILEGALRVVPILLVAYTAGGLVEVVFGIARKHPINEGFLVTGMLIPLIVPFTIPLWQVAVATIFAVVIGKEVFGGTGMNVLNVAMTARAFLYFAYPSQISGEIWTIEEGLQAVEGYSGATALAIAASVSAANSGMADPTLVMGAFADTSIFSLSFDHMFWGDIPGSIGETSTLMALIGGVILVATGMGSWQIIVSVFAGAFLMGAFNNAIAVNAFMALPAHYHLVMGGLAFGAVFMATDPVTASHTATGKWIYGFMIGVITVIIRVFNPAYPEGIMLAVLLMNVFAPLIDFYVVQANKKRRLQRATV